METAQHVLKDLGENNSLIQSCQRDLGHQLPLSSYLLKPVQRLTKYQLLLKELAENCPGRIEFSATCSERHHSLSGGLSGKFEIEESLEVMLGVIKLVNDSLHQPNIKGLPDELFPLGSLLYQETFLVLTIKTQTQATVWSHQSPVGLNLQPDLLTFFPPTDLFHVKLMLTLSPQIFSRLSKQKRQVLIYDNYLGNGSKCKFNRQPCRGNDFFNHSFFLALEHSYFKLF